MTSQIASIYFAPVHATRLYGGPYSMPAVALGAAPVLLPVTDRIQIEQGPYELGNNGRRSRRQHLVTGPVIARCLVSEWSEQGIGMTPQCRPGMWVVREQMPLLKADGTPDRNADGGALWRDATPDEREEMWHADLAAARAADRAYANLLFMQASAMAEDARLIPFIAPNARLAAKHYGFDAEWLRENAAIDVKPCPYCTRVIPAKAIKCPKCTEIVDVEGYALLEAQKATAIKLAKEAARAVA